MPFGGLSQPPLEVVVGDCFDELEAVDWEMILVVNPLHYYEFKNPNIQLHFLVPIEIINTNHILYMLHMNNFCNLSLNNVSCAAIMEGIRRNYKKIYLYGLDYDNYLKISVVVNNPDYNRNPNSLVDAFKKKP